MSAEEGVQRLDVHQRLQHLIMMVAFIGCGVTGWPIRTAQTETSRAIAEFLGGIVFCRVLHRVFGVLMIASAVYHVLYLAYCFKQRRLDTKMLPKLSDLKHVGQNFLYLVSLRKESPNFDRWAYWEKFDYWAVFWGMLIMGGTGLVLWFPVETAMLLPGWFLHVAHVVHADEALLALLAIFVWHMYNVHLRPGIWPMSPIWLTGRISWHELKRFHPAEYARIKAEKSGDPPAGEAKTEVKT